jgi:hypothetical protein
LNPVQTKKKQQKKNKQTKKLNVEHVCLTVELKTARSEDNFEEEWDDDDEVETPSPSSIVVPGFNLSSLQQRGARSAQDLHREKISSLQAERKARLQQDLIDCHQDLHDTMCLMGPGQTWGMSS